MTKTVEKVIVKNGCDTRDCGYHGSCQYSNFDSKDIVEVIFKGTFKQCQDKARKLSAAVGKGRQMAHCRYSSKDGYNYLSLNGHLIKTDTNNYCFIAEDNIEAYMSYEAPDEQTTEEIIEKDKKTFRSSVLSRVIRKSPRQTELNLRIKTQKNTLISYG